ncbi:MAG: SagB/ThcOx family dehydrogenase [Candidatus Krumholzibacteria bacterium]|nr:SagB/ThcOx family dehydrogenase [Candidatus Krumholzibacteria bacterium]
MALPQPRHDGEVSVERALRARRSVREYRKEALTVPEIAQMLWAAQGITDPDGLRTAPSAGALYPLEVYLVAANVEDLEPGVYKYAPSTHALVPLREGDQRKKVAAAALRQECVKTAPALLVFTAVYARTAKKYGGRAQRYAHMEVGHAAQNVYLQAEALGLGTVMVGAFDDKPLARALELPQKEAPLALMPLGKR